jgi:GAF domain-containing protein/HAMP domain-containing protein
MKPKFGIGQKILMVVVALLVLFTVGLAVWVGTTSFNNLTRVKQAELERMSQILAEQVGGIERGMVLVARSFEDNEQIAREISLITNLGPYYADPGSYFAGDFTGAGTIIDNADQIFTFQAYLNLIQALQSPLQLNDLSSISFYMGSPYNVVPSANPILAFRLSKDAIYVTRFQKKGGLGGYLSYRVSRDRFHPPARDYFDISTAYSALPEKFFTDNNFASVTSVENEYISRDWLEAKSVGSQIIIKNGIPVIQTWYPVRLLLPHFETWEEEEVVVGVAVVEKQLDAPVVAGLKRQLGLDVGFVQGGNLLINSLRFLPNTASPALGQNSIINFENASFYFARQPVIFKQTPNTGLEAIIFSPVSELTRLTQALRSQIVWVSLAAIVAISVAIYMAIQYLVNRPLGALTHSARLISAGNLSQRVTVESQDEAGLLGNAFNIMADQLRELIDSLESKVEARTKRLEIVASLGERISAILDPTQLLAETVNQIQANFGYYHAHIYLVNEDRTRLVVAAGTGPAGAAMQEKGHHIMLNTPTSLVAQAARTGHIVNVSNVREAADWLPNPLLPNTYSEMAVPIVLPTTNQVVGVLDVQQDRIAGLDESDASLLRSLANQVAVAINNARLFTQVESALAEAHLAQTRYIGQSWDKARIAAQGAQYHHVKPGTGDLSPDEIIKSKQQTLTQTQPALISLVGSSNSGQPDGNGPANPAGADGVHKAMVAPVRLRDKAIGAVQLHALDNQQPWVEQDLEVLEAVVDALAQTAENLRLFDETRQRASREQLTRQITDKVRAAPDVSTIIETGLFELAQALQVSRAYVKLNPAPAEPAANSSASSDVVTSEQVLE